MDQSKTVEVRIMQISPYSNPIPLVFAGCFIKKTDGVSLSGGVKQGWCDENKLFSGSMRQYLENGTTTTYDQSYYQ